MDAFLQFESITKSFGSHRAVDGVSVSLAQGDIFGLLGPSGCGKTTLLRLAAGFDQPDSGRILLRGRDITALPPERRPVNTVFQNYALFPHLTVFENIAFGLRVARRPAGEIQREAERMIALAQLAEHAQKRPSQLSGGQKQRVAIARALVNKPEVLLLDEPLAALDLKLRQHMLMELQAIHREVGTTFLFVTHDQGEAMSLCDRLAVMNQGRIEQEGTPRDIYTRPATAFVAGFIGDTNLMPVKSASAAGAGLVVLETDCLPRLLIPGEAGAVTPGALACVRPEKIQISIEHPGESAGAAVCQGRIEDTIYAGAESRYGVRAGAGKTWISRQHDAAHPELFGKGQTVWLRVNAEDVLLLRDPAETGPAAS